MAWRPGPPSVYNGRATRISFLAYCRTSDPQAIMSAPSLHEEKYDLHDEKPHQRESCPCQYPPSFHQGLTSRLDSQALLSLMSPTLTIPTSTYPMSPAWRRTPLIPRSGLPSPTRTTPTCLSTPSEHGSSVFSGLSSSPVSTSFSSSVTHPSPLAPSSPS